MTPSKRGTPRGGLSVKMTQSLDSYINPICQDDSAEGKRTGCFRFGGYLGSGTYPPPPPSLQLPALCFTPTAELQPHDRHMVWDTSSSQPGGRRDYPLVRSQPGGKSFESLMKASENHTNLVLQASYRNMAGEASGLVRELFTDVGLFLLGSELNVDDITSRFFDALFPLVYHHLINPSLSRVTPGYAECVRSARRDLTPFGAAPGVLANQIGKSGVGGRVLLQALHLGVEVINTTDRLVFSRECRRALLRMQYCPHCHGLTLSKPCMGYCLNVMRGCLASMAEVDPHWREFVRSLEGLSARMHGTQDLEQVLLGVHAVVHDAVAHAQRNGPHLSAQVYKVCGRPSRQPAQSVSGQQDGESIPLKAFIRETGNSLATRRKEFLSSLRLYRTFYGGLADQLCVNQLASTDGLACWNGADVVKSPLTAMCLCQSYL
ncbi:glypican-5-like [Oncorhynchus masou masou]|uniref:glypican-5-like n=1 Tax=Oncorhynchus masou masou TaxID=90313 RepID=UPI003183D182